jgi:uncharacterized protein with FMN-binding domain
LFHYSQVAELNAEVEKANANAAEAGAAVVEANERIERIAATASGAAEIRDVSAPLAAPESRYADGVYSGTTQGYGGPVTTEITIQNGVVVGIEITSADGEDAAYYNMCLGVLDEILVAQSADVDTVSGATYTSKGIIGGAREALSKAERKQPG